MEDTWTVTAREMLSYFGNAAIGVAARRAEDSARRGNWREADHAMRLLTRVEHLSQGAS